MLRLFGDDRNGLDARRTGPDHADTQSGEIDPFVRPQPRVIPLALETSEAGVVRRPWRRQIPRCHDAKPRIGDMALVGRYRPRVCPAVEDSLFDARIELDCAPQIEAIGDVVNVTQDLRLRAVAFGPMPVLLQFV